MNHSDNFKEELALISEAISSQNKDRLSQLSNSVYMNVRKAVARNKNAPAHIVNAMANNERASSVLYWLLQHPSCHLKKELSMEDLAHKCVTCDVSELELHTVCITCTK